MERREVSTSVVKWIEGLSNRVSIIIRRYIDQIMFAAFIAASFITFVPYYSGSIMYDCIYYCMFCMLLFNFVNFVFLLLCYVFFCLFKYSYCYECSILGILSHCVVLCIVYV